MTKKKRWFWAWPPEEDGYSWITGTLVTDDLCMTEGEVFDKVVTDVDFRRGSTGYPLKNLHVWFTWEIGGSRWKP